MAKSVVCERHCVYVYLPDGNSTLTAYYNISLTSAHMTVADAIRSACNCLCGKGYSSMFFTWAAVNNRQVVHLSI